MNKPLVSILFFPLVLGVSSNCTYAMKLPANPIAKMAGGAALIGAGAIDKQKLTDCIKGDIYTIYIEEIAIVHKDWLSIAQGNAELERDLKELYQNFSSDIDSTQKKLNEFCQKWKLDAITIY